MKVKPGRQKFNTPIEVGTAYNANTNNDKSVDEQIDAYLADRRKRLLDEAKLAELEHVSEDEKTGAARSRKERELLEKGELSPTGKEEDMEDTEKKIEDAAEVAAEAAGAGVDPEQAKDLGAGKTRLAIIKPGGEQVGGEKGGWSVLNGRPIRDPEGEYTFSQALKVAQLEVPRTPTENNKKSLGEELAEAKQKLEAIGITVGGPAPTTSPRPLKEEVQEAVSLLKTLGIPVGASPQAPLKEQVAEAKSLLEGLGLSIGLPGESLDTIREKFRHEERMDEIRADREYKERLADIASEIPERIGSGIGEDMRRSRGTKGQKASSGSNLPSFTCEECGKEFPITPEAEREGILTCPYCNMTYKRGGGDETGKGGES